jgi:hypothetical protein
VRFLARDSWLTYALLIHYHFLLQLVLPPALTTRLILNIQLQDDGYSQSSSRVARPPGFPVEVVDHLVQLGRISSGKLACSASVSCAARYKGSQAAAKRSRPGHIRQESGKLPCSIIVLRLANSSLSRPMVAQKPSMALSLVLSLSSSLSPSFATISIPDSGLSPVSLLPAISLLVVKEKSPTRCYSSLPRPLPRQSLACHSHTTTTLCSRKSSASTSRQSACGSPT